MIRSTLGASIGAALVIAAPATAQRAGAGDLPKLLPMPKTIARGSGTLTVAAGTGVVAETPLAQPAAALLIDHVRTARGIALAPAEAATARIRFVADPAIKGDEAYRLSVARDGVRVAASAAPGFVHGAMTLVQLLSPDARVGQPVRVPAMTIEDSPRFAWRGLMLDTARHFLPLPEVEKIVDQMAAVKLNTLHLHLSDDQGWRFEVKRYPKLTEVGAWRTPPSTGGAAPTQRYGGFYTQDELRGLVRYAADRGITIVPEVDLPGHAQALVAAYPEFGVLGDRPETGNGWGIFPYLLNPGPEGVAFVKQVLDELIDVFPGTYVHLGGDEAVKDQWERSPAVQAQIRALNLKDENALQSWLIDELGTYLSSKGRRLIGWDEILEGGLPPSASVMSWRGEKGAVDAANQNHDVVLSPAPTMYINYLQSHRADEPPGPIQVQTLADTYAYEPMPKGLDPAKAGHVLGAQMNLWSEYLVTPYQYQHSIFPRLAALAENSWIERPRDFAGFLTRLQPQVARWKRGGVEVADSSAAVDFRVAGTRGEVLRGKRVNLTLAQDAPQGTIRYTLDGSAPTPRSRRYTAPLSLPFGQTVRAAPFDAAGTALAAPRAFDTGREALLTRVSGEMAACPGETRGLRVPLTADATGNTPTFDVNIFNLCSVYPAAPLDVAGGFTVEVARLARNHGLAHDFDKVRRHFNVTPHGELLVMLGCPAMKDGKPVPDAPRPAIVASFPLPDPASSPQRQRFTGTLPAMDGDRDLCFQFTSPLTEPLYAVERVSLTDRR